MNGAGISVDSGLVGAVNELADPLAIGDRYAVFGQRTSDGDIIDFLETAGTLAFQGARTRHEDHRRSFAPCLHHGRNGVGEPFRPDKADGRFAGYSGVPVGKVAGHLLVRAVYHLHLTFHEPFQRRIAKPSGKGEDMLYALFLQGARQKRPATDFADAGHALPAGRTANPGCDDARQCRPRPATELWPSKPITVAVSLLT